MRLIDLLDPPAPPTPTQPEPEPLSIEPGLIYHDGRFGFREVLSVCRTSRTVRYRIIAAKSERAWCAVSACTRTLIGDEAEGTLSQFVKWAKVCYKAEEGQQRALEMRLSRLTLSAAEKDLLRQIGTATLTLTSMSPRKEATLRLLRFKGLLEPADPLRATQLGLEWMARQLDSPPRTGMPMQRKLAILSDAEKELLQQASRGRSTLVDAQSNNPVETRNLLFRGFIEPTEPLRTTAAGRKWLTQQSGS